MLKFKYKKESIEATLKLDTKKKSIVNNKLKIKKESKKKKLFKRKNENKLMQKAKRAIINQCKTIKR